MIAARHQWAGSRPHPLAAFAPSLIRPGLVLGVALLVLAFVLPVAAFGAVLLGWIMLLSGGVGASVLLCTHALTGGRWGEEKRTHLCALAATVPAVALIGIVPLLGQGFIYPWASGAAVTDKPMVAVLYLNAWLFTLRATVILAGWSAIAWLVSGPIAPGRVVAGLALLFYGITVNFAAYDWLMSLDPGWTSTAFGAFFAIVQIALALALVARGAPTGRKFEALVRDDVAKLLLAAILGIIYLLFMQYLVQWSGNLPEKVAFFVARTGWGWVILIVAALLIGGACPFAILSRSALRQHAGPVALAAGGTIVGLGLMLLWIAGPALGGLIGTLAAAVTIAAAGSVADHVGLCLPETDLNGEPRQ